MDVTAWSKKMLEESKIEVRELREQVSVLTNKRLKCENELQNTNRSLENTEQRAKMLGIGAWEGTHDVDIQTRKIKSDLERISKQVDAVEEFQVTLQVQYWTAYDGNNADSVV